MSLFRTGLVMTTPRIMGIMSASREAADAIQKCLERHCSGDWGDMCDDDKQLNQDSLDEEREKGYTCENLFSMYETDYGCIYIITECDRSATTILLPEEY